MGRADPAPPPSDPTGSWPLAAAGPILLLAAGSTMLAWTWRAWPDPLVDFGRELYVPWRLSQGEALYRDVAWFNGPLSQHWNALLFRVFGPGLSVLVWSNVLVLAATVAMAYAVVARVAGRLAAAAAGAVFLLVFAFGQYVGIANYNWITPYSHEITHGVALALAAVVALERWSRTGSTPSLALGALALGLCFLTKAEPFLAGAAGCSVMLAPSLLRRDARAIAVFTGAALAPIALSTVLVGWQGTVGAWPSVLAGEVAELAFYVEGTGFDDPLLRLAEVAAWSAMWLLVLSLPLAVAWLARETKAPWVAAAAGLAMLVGLALSGDQFAWRESVRPLALVALSTAFALGAARWRGARTHRNLLALALTEFSLALLAKMLLNVRVAHYGFALAMPATLLVVVLLVGWLPAWLARRGVRGDVFLACALAVLTVFSARHVAATADWMARKTETVGSGRDAFRADARGALVRRAVDTVRAAGAATLAVLPEGVMINYLARVRAPTEFVTFMPPEEILFGDEAWTDAFRGSPPDLVLRVPRDVSEYGRGSFGTGFGRSLAAWIDARYVRGEPVTAPGLSLEIDVLTPRR